MIKRFEVEPESCDSNSMRLQLSTKLGFVNNTGKTVSVIRRDGCVDIIPPTLSTMGDRGKFEIMYSVNANQAVLQDMLTSSYLSATERRIYTELKKHGTTLGGQHALKYAVPAVELVDMEGVYLESLDLVVTMRPRDNLPKHPYSASSGMALISGDVIDDVFTFRLAMVNKFNTVGDLFVKVCGATVKIPKVESEALPDGIYVSHGIGKDVRMRHFTFTDGDVPFTMYDTEREADIYGGELTTALEKLNKREREFDERVKQWEVEKRDLIAERDRQLHLADIDKQMLTHVLNEQERKLENIKKREEHEIKLQETTTKSRADEQATVRKNTTEWLKVVPHILGTVTLAAAMYNGGSK